MERAFLNPAGLPNWDQSFSQVVVSEAAAARTIYVSGQVSVGPDHQVLAAGDLGAQARHAFANLKTALAAAGAAPADVVKLDIYVVNYRPEQASVVTAAQREVFGTERLPASTWLGVQSLALADLLIEIDAIAVTSPDRSLLEPLLDSWERNNTILVNLLRALPAGGLAVRAGDSPSVAQLFTHIHYVRLAFVSEDAPECAAELPEEEWRDERDAALIEAMLHDSARAVRAAVTSRLEAGREMDLHYDHPILLLQHMIWHEGYHHGQIKLALKAQGLPIADREAGPTTWGVWMRKTGRGAGVAGMEAER